MHFRPTDGGMFPAFPKLLRAGLLRRLDPEMIHAELMVQLDDLQGHVRPRAGFRRRPPACAIVSAGARRVSAGGERKPHPDAWVRQGGRHQPLAQRLGAPKALVLDVLSAQFRKRAARPASRSIPPSPAPMISPGEPDFGALMRQFLDGLPEGGLVMCHPGFVDETLVSLDPLTTQREHEHAFLAGEHFPPLLAANNVTLA